MGFSFKTLTLYSQTSALMETQPGERGRRVEGEVTPVVIVRVEVWRARCDLADGRQAEEAGEKVGV